MLPKSPLAAAGVGLLLGAGIGGLKGWLDIKKGNSTQKEAVANAIKQGLLFGGVAAASTFAGGNKGGGAGLATMAAVGLSDGSGLALPAMLSSISGGGGRRMGGGGMPGEQEQKGSGQSSTSALDTVSNAMSEVLVSAITQKTKEPNSNISTTTHNANTVDSANDNIDTDVEPTIISSASS